MRSRVLARRLGSVLGGLYILAGIAETVRLFVTGDGGFVFWFGTLVGGGFVILVGTFRLESHPGWSRAAVVLGALLGIPATAWTVVVPLLAVAVVIVKLAAPNATGAAATPREV